jgi:hypothetical protein
MHDHALADRELSEGKTRPQLIPAMVKRTMGEMKDPTSGQQMGLPDGMCMCPCASSSGSQNSGMQGQGQLGQDNKQSGNIGDYVANDGENDDKKRQEEDSNLYNKVKCTPRV